MSLGTNEKFKADTKIGKEYKCFVSIFSDGHFRTRFFVCHGKLEERFRISANHNFEQIRFLRFPYHCLMIF